MSQSEPLMVGREEIAAAAAALAGVVVRTPLLPTPWSPDLFLKPESLQHTGSFKLRGAYHTVARLPAARRAAGVVTQSSGNHGRAVAFAARAFGAAATVVMPEAAAAHKVDAVRRLGAEVMVVPPAQRAARTGAVAAERGLAVVPPYDHPHVIAGQGTVGWEIADEAPDVEVVLVPVGGGGLASGVAAALAARCPRARVVGVEPELAADARESFVTGELRAWPVERTYRTAADGLRTQLSPLTLAHLRAYLFDVVTVTEAELLETAGALLTEARLVAEPSGAVALAAWRHRRAQLPVGRTVAVVSGGNLAPADVPGLLERAGVGGAAAPPR